MATNEKRAGVDQRGDMADIVTNWASVVTHAPLPIAITTGETHILRFVNTAFARRRHVEARVLLLRSFADCFPEAEDDGTA